MSHIPQSLFLRVASRREPTANDLESSELCLDGSTQTYYPNPNPNPSELRARVERT